MRRSSGNCNAMIQPRPTEYERSVGNVIVDAFLMRHPDWEMNWETTPRDWSNTIEFRASYNGKTFAIKRTFTTDREWTENDLAAVLKDIEVQMTDAVARDLLERGVQYELLDVTTFSDDVPKFMPGAAYPQPSGDFAVLVNRRLEALQRESRPETIEFGGMIFSAGKGSYIDTSKLPPDPGDRRKAEAKAAAEKRARDREDWMQREVERRERARRGDAETPVPIRYQDAQGNVDYGPSPRDRERALAELRRELLRVQSENEKLKSVPKPAKHDQEPTRRRRIRLTK